MAEPEPVPSVDAPPTHDPPSINSATDTDDGMPEEPLLMLPSLVARPPEPSEGGEEDAAAESLLLQVSSPRGNPVPGEALEGSSVGDCELDPAPALLEAAEAARALGMAAGCHGESAEPESCEGMVMGKESGTDLPRHTAADASPCPVDPDSQLGLPRCAEEAKGPLSPLIDQQRVLELCDQRSEGLCCASQVTIPTSHFRATFNDPRQACKGVVSIIGFCSLTCDVAWDLPGGFLRNCYDLGPKGLQLEAPCEPGKVLSFRNAEAAFQALQFWRMANEYSDLSGDAACTKSRKLRGTEDHTFGGFGSDWKGMHAVLTTKFSSGTTCAEGLLKTEDAFLVEHNSARGNGTSLDDPHGHSANWLGVQLMLIRDQLSGRGTWTSYLSSLMDLDTGRPHAPDLARCWCEVVGRAVGALRGAEAAVTVDEEGVAPAAAAASGRAGEPAAIGAPVAPGAPPSATPTAAGELPCAAPDTGSMWRNDHPCSMTEKLLLCYTKQLGKCPCVFMSVYIVCLTVLIAAAWHPFELEEDFTAFIRADGRAMRNHEAFGQAIAERKDLKDSRRLRQRGRFRPGLDGTEGGGTGSATAMRHRCCRGSRPHHHRAWRRLTGSRLFVRQGLTLVYAARGGNALDERALREVRDFEQRLRELPGWQRLCRNRVVSDVRRRLCDPGESLAALAWPSRTQPAGDKRGLLFQAHFNAQGLDLLPQPALLAYMREAHEIDGEDSRDPLRYFPKDYELPPLGRDPAEKPPQLLRTKFEFHMRVGTGGQSAATTKAEIAQVKEEFNVLMEKHVYPLLVQAEWECKHVHLYYSGDFISAYEVIKTLMMDVLWAVGSIIFVTVCMWLHSHSLLLSICSFLTIFVSIPVAYVLTPASKTTIASFLSIFLVTGIGSDVVFVFTDFWHQSEHLKDTDKRLAHLIAHAGKATLATSLTTSVSFFANLASVLQPLREFGMFMGLCVMSTFLLVLLFLPPLLMVAERRRERASRRIVDISSGEWDTLAVMPASRPRSSRFCLCSRHAGRSHGHQTCTQVFLSWLVERLSRCPLLLLGMTVLCMVVFTAGVAAGAQLHTGVPDIFPPEHNQVAGQAAASKFLTMGVSESAAPASGSVCAADEGNPPIGRCLFRLCDAAPASAAAARGAAGACWRGPVLPVGSAGSTSPTEEGAVSCRELRLRVRAAAPEAPPGGEPGREWAESLRLALGHAVGRDLSWKVRGERWEPLEALGLEDWETGRVEMSPFFDSPAMWLVPEEPAVNSSGHGSSGRSSGCPADTKNCSDGSAVCEVHAMCFLGTHRCELPGWEPLGQNDPAQRRALADAAPPGPPPEARVLLSKQIGVSVVYGLRAPRSTPLIGKPSEVWSFDPLFEPSNPWAQRAMLAMCTDLPPRLLVVDSKCWVGSFRSWLRDSSRRFPSRDFDAELILWYNNNPTLAQESLWMVDRTMKACAFSFRVNVSPDASSRSILEYMGNWDEFVDSRNTMASVTANRAWYTTRALVRAEAEDAIVKSTFTTILISVGCGVLGMLAFTWEPVLSLLVLAMVLEIICGLAFFMVVVMRWEVGAIEVLSLVVFVGYSVTYALHVAHSYSAVSEHEVLPLLPGRAASAVAPWTGAAEAKAGVAGAVVLAVGAEEGEAVAPPLPTPRQLRVARVRLAVLRVGGAMLSSAASTAGSSAFLLGCTLRFFGKLGSVVMAVTLLSIVFSLVSLPAVLMVLGPREDPCYKRHVQRMAMGLLQGHGAGSEEDQKEPLMVGRVLS